MIFTILILLLGFVLLVKGADFFVSGAAAIAQHFHIPEILIGLTIVAFGTSAPEASVSITASLIGDTEISLANIIGSNIFNFLFILGAASVITPIAAQKSVVAKDFPFAILAPVVLLILAADQFLNQAAVNQLTRGDGLILLCFFLIFMVYIIQTGLKARNDFKDAPTGEQKPTLKTGQAVLLLALGLVGIILGGTMVVNSAEKIALAWGMSQKLVGLTIVAIGTSLPELVTSVVASIKGQNDIALGNLVGSNIFNIFFIGGMSAALAPMPANSFVLIDTFILVGASLLCLLFAKTRHQVSKKEGLLLLLCYAAYLAYIIIRN